MSVNNAKRHRQDIGPPAEAPPVPEVTWAYTIDGIRSIDRTAERDYLIPGILLMENAARHLAEVTLSFIPDHRDISPHVVIVCGGGNNGGDGLAAARHLHNAGCAVTIVMLATPREGTDAARQHAICAAMGLRMRPIDQIDQVHPPAIVIDAIFGVGLDREISGAPAKAVEWINGQEAPVIAADIPSGLHAERGTPMGVAVRADATVTFVGPKTGMLELSAQPFVGELIVVDIGAPIELHERFGIELTVHRDDGPRSSPDPPPQRRERR